MPKTQHYLRIHRRVARRLWTDLSQRQRDIIAADDLHATDEFKWFEAKVNTDALRLYEDPAYYDNQEHTFRIPNYEQL
jgi:hypothetical protein